MRIVVLGATGRVGTHVVEQALAAGHAVTAVVRSSRPLHPSVQPFNCDLLTASAADLIPALSGADSVLSCLGHRSRADLGVTAHGTTAVIGAMRRTGVRRLVVISAAPVGGIAPPDGARPPRRQPGDGPLMSWLAMPLMRAALQRPYADLAAMETEVRRTPPSGDGTWALDWTIVRPPRLTNRPQTASYRSARDGNVRRGLRIGRADLAHCMLSLAADASMIGHTVGVAY